MKSPCILSRNVLLWSIIGCAVFAWSTFQSLKVCAATPATVPGLERKRPPWTSVVYANSAQTLDFMKGNVHGALLDNLDSAIFFKELTSTVKSFAVMCAFHRLPQQILSESAQDSCTVSPVFKSVHRNGYARRHHLCVQRMCSKSCRAGAFLRYRGCLLVRAGSSWHSNASFTAILVVLYGFGTGTGKPRQHHRTTWLAPAYSPSWTASLS